MDRKKSAKKPAVARSIPPPLNSGAFLVRADDIQAPMHEAWQALEFARQFVDLMLLADGYEVYPATLEVAGGAITDAARKLDAALGRVRRVSGAVLVADPNPRSLDEISEAMKAREVAEAAR